MGFIADNANNPPPTPLSTSTTVQGAPHTLVPHSVYDSGMAGAFVFGGLALIFVVGKILWRAINAQPEVAQRLRVVLYTGGFIAVIYTLVILFGFLGAAVAIGAVFIGRWILAGKRA